MLHKKHSGGCFYLVDLVRMVSRLLAGPSIRCTKEMLHLYIFTLSGEAAHILNSKLRVELDYPRSQIEISPGGRYFYLVDLVRIELASPQCECGVLPLYYRPFGQAYHLLLAYYTYNLIIGYGSQ